MHREIGVDTLRGGISSYRRSEETDLSKSEQYRRFARESLQMADDATDPRVQAIMIHMAQVWVRLAQEHEEQYGQEREAGRDADHAPAEPRSD